MMNVKVALAAMVAVCVSLGGVNARTLRNADEPAEFPPSSFSGKQYVDSRGCVYIRAGIDGNVTWIPRVARNRTVICGFQPTRSASAPVAVQPVAPKPVPRVANVLQRTPSQQAVSISAPKPIVRRAAPVLRAAPVSAPRVRRVAAVPKPVIATSVRVARAKPVRVAAPAAVSSAPACRGASPISQLYVGRNRPGLPVRCGPQARTNYSNATYGRRVAAPIAVAGAPRPTSIPSVATAPRVAQGTGATRIVPRHVYEAQIASRIEITPPTGFRRAWNDDRLNPHRAHQTVAGKMQMDLVWTQEVPRRLIDANSNRDVTGQFPTLIYPYVDMDAQLRYRGTGSRIGQSTRRAVVKTPGRVMRVSTKSVAPMAATRTARPSVSSGHKYVQVGTFAVVGNAEKTAARLGASGLPVRYGRLTRNGKAFRVVLAGPFNTSADLSAGLRMAQRAGFRDAFTRN